MASHRTMLLWLSRVFLGFGEKVGDLLSESRRAGMGEADGGDDALLAAAETDKPDPVGGPASGTGGAGVDLDGDGLYACFRGR